MKKTKCLLCAALMMLMAFCLIGCGSDDEKQNEITFPVVLSDGLTVDSLFASDAMNPDADLSMVENLASIQVTNTTDQYVEQAEIKVMLADGTELEFRIQDLPVGKKVLAFEAGNNTLPTDAICRSFNSEAVFVGSDVMQDVSVSCLGLDAVVTNTSDTTKENMTVYFHCLLDDMYYGGKSYNRTIDSLAPEESVTLTVDECFIGETEAVRVIY